MTRLCTIYPVNLHCVGGLRPPFIGVVPDLRFWLLVRNPDSVDSDSWDRFHNNNPEDVGGAHAEKGCEREMGLSKNIDDSGSSSCSLLRGRPLLHGET